MWEYCYISAAIFLRGFAIILILNIWTLLDLIQQKKWGEKSLILCFDRCTDKYQALP